MEAKQWDGDNATEIVNWAQGGWGVEFRRPDRGGIWLKQKVFEENPLHCLWFLMIPTREGESQIAPGDWVVKDEDGNLHTCKRGVFEAIQAALRASR